MLCFSELNVPFCVDEIVKACKTMNSGKSAGSDYGLNEFFKYCSCCYGFVNVIRVLFNKVFDSRYFPADWSEGFIVPLHKKGILMMLVTAIQYLVNYLQKS